MTSNNISIIQKLMDHGLCVFPLVHKTKQPPKDLLWELRTVNTNNLDEFRSEARNVGVKLGEISGGIVCIDLDQEFAEKVGPHYLPATGWKFGRAEFDTGFIGLLTLARPASSRAKFPR